MHLFFCGCCLLCTPSSRDVCDFFTMRWFPILFASVACLPLVRAPFAFSRFAYTSVKTDTGFEEGTITHLWNKYNAWNGSPPGDRLSWLAHMICFLCWHGLSTGCVVRALHTGTFGYQLDPRQRRPAMRAFYFFLVFVYMHKMPQLNWIEAFRSRDGAFEASTSSFQDNVFPIATALANIICEINYNWRLDPFNQRDCTRHLQHSSCRSILTYITFELNARFEYYSHSQPSSVTLAPHLSCLRALSLRGGLYPIDTIE
jgi:hypothetical protein